MPELPEVETVRRGLADGLSGARIYDVMLGAHGLRKPFPANMADRLQGAVMTAFRRRGKYLIIDVGEAGHIIAHLGMSGRFTILPADGRNWNRGKHDHAVFRFDGGGLLVYTDPRRFGIMDLSPPGEWEQYPAIAGLGPEPLEDGFNAKILYQTASNRRTPLKSFLLDQKIIAGLGNIYVCEALHRARLLPQRQAGSLKPRHTEILASTIKQVLTEAIAAGGSTLKDYAHADGELGYFQHQFAVYGRDGQNCKTPGCNGIVERMVQSGRSTFFCPSCQQ